MNGRGGGKTAYYVESAMLDENSFNGKRSSTYNIVALESREAERVRALDSQVSGLHRTMKEEDRELTRSERARMDGYHRERTAILNQAGRRAYVTMPIQGAPYRVGDVLSQAEFGGLRIRSSRTLGNTERVGR